MNRSYAELATETWKMVGAKKDWLSKFSSGKNKFPDWTIQIKQIEYDVLKQIAQMLDKAAAREK